MTEQSTMFGFPERVRLGLCGWCHASLGAARAATRSGRFCGRKCRQAAFRARKRSYLGVCEDPGDLRPARFAYADPPYPGLSARYYGKEPTFAGEVDHAALVASLAAGGFLGWALSTSARALRDVLPLCPPETRVCAWVKPHGIPSTTYGLHNAWEPLLVVGGRRLRPGKRDWLRAQPARFEGELMGRKPLAFCGFLFDSLGMLPGDELVDLFPGTGIVSRAWAEVSSRGASSGPGEYLTDASSTAIAPGDAASASSSGAGGERRRPA